MSESHITALGAPVASGLGKDQSLPPQFYLYIVALTVVPMGIFYFLAHAFGMRDVALHGFLNAQLVPTHTHLFFVLLGMGVVVAVILVNLALAAASRIRKTEVFVYQNGVAGMAVSSKLQKLRPFCLEYSKLKSASVAQGLAGTSPVVISTKDGDLYVFPPNGNNICTEISARLPLCAQE